jgi:putative hydrolase of the HAD superfamily
MNAVRFRPAAVIFDFFGTLTMAIQRGPAHATVATLLGCDPIALAAALDRTFRDRCTGGLGSPAAVLLALAKEQGVEPSETALAAAVLARVDAVAADVVLRDDAVGTLTAVRRLGVRTAVLSDCWYELPVIVPTLPIAPLLDATIYSCWLGRSKPAPTLYHTVCERIGVPPAKCLYVGDGGGRELSGASGVGMTAVRLAAADLATHLTFDTEPVWDGPTVRTLREVLAWLAK